MLTGTRSASSTTCGPRSTEATRGSAHSTAQCTAAPPRAFRRVHFGVLSGSAVLRCCRGLCTDNAEFSDRIFPLTMLDDEGFLYVMGGIEENNGGRKVNDVWKSVFSYNDVNEVAARCNLFVPSCGVGLKCLPDDPNFMQGGWGVSCDACPYTVTVSNGATPSSSLSMAQVMTILFVVFLLLFLLTLAALVFSYWKLRGSGVSSPIPLPAGAQRWWNSNTETAGLSEGLSKDTAPSDTYSQLSIRDQM